MIEFELTDGKLVWVNALTIRSVMSSASGDHVNVDFVDNTRLMVKGNPATLQGEIHKTLRAIHTPTGI